MLDSTRTSPTSKPQKSVYGTVREWDYNELVHERALFTHGVSPRRIERTRSG